jgi:hypothetical protein
MREVKDITPSSSEDKKRKFLFIGRKFLLLQSRGLFSTPAFFRRTIIHVKFSRCLNKVSQQSLPSQRRTKVTCGWLNFRVNVHGRILELSKRKIACNLVILRPRTEQ